MGRNRPQRRQRLQGQQYTQQYQQPVAPKAFNQGALGSSKGDASYDPYSDTDGDGMVSITDYGAYMKNNPQGAGLSQPIPAQQPSLWIPSTVRAKAQTMGGMDIISLKPQVIMVALVALVVASVQCLMGVGWDSLELPASEVGTRARDNIKMVV